MKEIWCEKIINGDCTKCPSDRCEERTAEWNPSTFGKEPLPNGEGVLGLLFRGIIGGMAIDPEIKKGISEGRKVIKMIIDDGKYEEFLKMTQEQRNATIDMYLNKIKQKEEER